MLKWFRALFAWRFVRSTAVWAYYENEITGAREAHRIGPGNQPPDLLWLRGGRSYD
jgi:hypothetical protein